MPQTTYGTLAFSGYQAKRAYPKTTTTTSMATTTTSSCCGSSYPYGPYVYNYNGCNGVTVYKTSTGGLCCCNTSSGKSEECPGCVY
jgi:hypothetical protein